ncbi:stress response NST1-like protein [Thalictrum thalictroides]|uniref:Stress response NST1-like protein n=1 Tax=Thalictrum thalictroides TaxID=46969 RepID=A0A7J6VFG2_THATH|nr:stress response NST1-like protein [Thalictrum thalictroides]
MRGFLLRDIPRKFLNGARICQHTKFLCSSANNTNSSKALGEAKSVRDLGAYRQLDKLDFMTAAKILFTTPNLTLDFHLVQIFFACMPPLAVYLVAQYARYEIKRMEVEEEVKKKKAEEEEKAKVMEALALEEEKRKNDPELLQVKARLGALEDALKGIAVE